MGGIDTAHGQVGEGGRAVEGACGRGAMERAG